LSYLLQNKKETLDTYIDAIALCKKSASKKAYLEAALKDIQDAILQVGKLPHADDIIELLQLELGSE